MGDLALGAGDPKQHVIRDAARHLLRIYLLGAQARSPGYVFR
ncbi:hypothetical protein [Tritonibacter multivorans]|nr:hypothetical protein [Tritonibacter multivorans]